MTNKSNIYTFMDAMSHSYSYQFIISILIQLFNYDEYKILKNERVNKNIHSIFKMCR